MVRREVIVVGSGPAGAATALGIAARDPALGRATLVLEKARHPRDKTCAGGLIPKGVRLLEELGLSLDVPNVVVDRAAVDTPRGRVDLRESDLCRVIRRRELDAMIAWAARDRGVELREGERVLGLERAGSEVRVTTDAETYVARTVVGADGAGSHVRRALVPGSGGIVARAVMADVAVARSTWDGWAARRYDFDFRSCARGLRGYRWIFPCLVDGVPTANVGVYALPPTGGVRLQAELHALAGDVGAALDGWKAFPIRTLTRRSVVAAPHAVLVGDAAGVDPLMGEGISFALEYAALAADAVVAAHRHRDWSYVGYGRAVHDGPIGRKLHLLGVGAGLFYGRASRVAFRLAAASRRAQGIGLRWYNGVDRWDERGPLAALAALLRHREADAA
jgi:flavin-dependent dehydrogenase